MAEVERSIFTPEQLEAARPPAKPDDLGGNVPGAVPGYTYPEKSTEVDETKQTNYAALGIDRYEVISAWIKEMRLSNVDRALYWTLVMKQAKESMYYLGRRLGVFAGEDCGDHMTYLVLTNTALLLKNGLGDWNNVMYAVVAAAKGAKFFTSKEGRELEAKYRELNAAVEHGSIFQPPPYAVDNHTARGKRLRYEGKADCRYSGDWGINDHDQRRNMCREAEVNERLGYPKGTLDETLIDPVTRKTCLRDKLEKGKLEADPTPQAKAQAEAFKAEAAKAAGKAQ